MPPVGRYATGSANGRCVWEEYLVRIAIKGILTGLAAVGFFTVAPTAAQQTNPTNWLVADDQPTPVAMSGASEAQPSAGIVDYGHSSQTSELVFPDDPTFEESGAEAFCEVCGEGESAPPDWYLEQDLCVIARGRARRTALTHEIFDVEINELQADGTWQTTAQGVQAFTQMTTRSLAFDVSPGYAATLGHYLGRDNENRDQFVELSYWGLHSWREARQYNGYRLEVPFRSEQNEIRPVVIGSLLSNFDFPEFSSLQGASQVGRQPFDSTIGGFNRVDLHAYSYGSDLNNVEFNVRLRPRSRADRLVLHPNGRWRRECRPGHYTSYLFGVRYLSINEAFRWHSEGVIDDRNNPIAPGFVDVSGDYSARTHNDMVGLQVGCDMMYRRCKWSWGVRTKAGPFINMADQNSDVVTDALGDPWFKGGDLDIHRLARKNEASLVAEVGFTGTYRIRPNLTLNATYDFMWVTGLALAAEQLRFERNPPTEVNVDGHIYYHGLSLGFEWRR